MICSKCGLCLSQHVLSNQVFHLFLCIFSKCLTNLVTVPLFYVLNVGHVHKDADILIHRPHAQSDSFSRIPLQGLYCTSRMFLFTWTDLSFPLCSSLSLLRFDHSVFHYDIYCAFFKCKQDIMSFYLFPCVVVQRGRVLWTWVNQVNHQYFSLSCTIMADMDDIYCYSDS